MRRLLTERRSAFEQTPKHAQRALLALLVLCFSIHAWAPLAFALSADVKPPADYLPPMQADLSARQGAIVDRRHNRLLFSLGSRDSIAIPLSARLMTALIACEEITAKTPITISKTVADSNEVTDDRVTLKAGERYPFEYLLNRLVFYNSKAAALALAEQIAGSEINFVNKMNQRALALGMSRTRFANCNGRETSPGAMDEPETLLQTQGLVGSNSSSAYDLTLLLRAGIRNGKFAETLSRKEDHMMFTLSNSQTPVYVPMQHAHTFMWTYTDNQITGVMSTWDQEGQTTVGYARINDIEFMFAIVGSTMEQSLKDLQNMLNSFGQTYEDRQLATAGQVFEGMQDTTDDGASFGLRFKDDVHYAATIFGSLIQTREYKSIGVHRRPIQMDEVVGTVTWTLHDGTTIMASILPDRQILSSNSILNRLLGSLYLNPNILVALTICMSLLLLSVIWQIFRRSRQLFRLVQLFFLIRKD